MNKRSWGKGLDWAGRTIGDTEGPLDKRGPEGSQKMA